MPTVRDGGVVWCEVCQQSETEVWCGVVWCGVRCANSQRQSVVWCEVCEGCQQSETEVWCSVRCVRGANSQRQRCGVV